MAFFIGLYTSFLALFVIIDTSTAELSVLSGAASDFKAEVFASIKPLGNEIEFDLKPVTGENGSVVNNKLNKNMWNDYIKPTPEVLKKELDEVTYQVTQEEGTERSGTSPLDKNYEPGIYVDVLSGEPLFSSKHKYDSGTGWPSFTEPIAKEAVTAHEDKKLFSSRTEIRSAIANNHLGHVFGDGPADKGGERYCMNGVALRFIPKAEMEAQGYGDFLSFL